MCERKKEHGGSVLALKAYFRRREIEREREERNDEDKESDKQSILVSR